MILNERDVAQELKRLNKNYVTDEQFRNMFASSSLARQQAISALDYDYSSAVNDAYIASMANTNAITTSPLGQGYKEQVLAANQEALLDAFTQYKQNYASGLQSVTSQYDEIDQGIYDMYNTQEKSFAEQAGQFTNYWSEHYNYLKYLYENGYTLGNSSESIFATEGLSGYINEDGTLKSRHELFDPVAEEVIDPNTGEVTYVQKGIFDAEGNLTDVGKQYLETVENLKLEGAPTFSEYLYDTQRKTYDWLYTNSAGYDTSNYELFRRATGLPEYGANDKPQLNTRHHAIANVADTWTTDYVQLTRDNIIPSNYLASKEKNIDEVYKVLESDNWKIGDEAYTPERFKESAKSLTDGQAGSKRTKTIIDAADAAARDELVNGTIIDINRGGGVELWVYWNGNFHALEAQGEYDKFARPNYGTQQDRNYQYYKKGNKYYKSYTHIYGSQLPHKTTKVEEITKEEYDEAYRIVHDNQ